MKKNFNEEVKIKAIDLKNIFESTPHNPMGEVVKKTKLIKDRQERLSVFLSFLNFECLSPHEKLYGFGTSEFIEAQLIIKILEL